MVKAGDKYVCGVCGLEVVCTEGCGCGVSELVCCGREMKRKAQEKPKKAGKASR